jgi:FemAB-related protein (PEP-CTERM system-associated)
MQVESINDSSAGAWQEFVLRNGETTFYHNYGWRAVVERPYGLKTHYLTAVEDGKIRGILPLAEAPRLSGKPDLVSTPFASYGGIAADTPEARDALLDAAVTLLKDRRLPLLELKQDIRCDSDRLTEKLDYHALALELAADPDDVWRNRLSGKARNQVRKAKKMGVTATVGGELLPEFIEVYRRNLRDLGTPTHSVAWFKEVARQFPDETTVVVAWLAGKPVAAGWVFFFKDIAIMHAAASLREHLRICPNNLVYWTAIEHVCQRGCRLFDFARSRIDAGTYHFKKQWGAEPRQTHYQYLLNTAPRIPDMDPHNPKFRLMIATWQRLPLSIANTIGPILRRRISP